MPPALAALLFTSILVVLMWRDVRQNPEQSSGLWVPLIWMFLAGGRWASTWLDLRPPMDSPEAFAEGSPLDAAVFLSLIVAAIVTLIQRSLRWDEVIRRNALLVTYFAFCLVSATWSDEPLITVKRWLKDLGNPIMALVILTDKNPINALTTVLRRLSYLFLVLSVLFIRYYPDLGRQYHHDGSPMYTGVGMQKNQLGQMCLIAGIYFAWLLIYARDRYRAMEQKDRWITLGLIGCTTWLQAMSNSQTALSCLIVCVTIIAMTRLPGFRGHPRRVPIALVCGALLFISLEGMFDLRATILELLGRRPDLTDRTHIWSYLLTLGKNPFVGTGFMSFWMGGRMESVWLNVGTIIQAHSGYLEQYLNLGWIGVGFIAMLMLRALVRIYVDFVEEPSMSMLRLCFLVAAALYNYTEAAFYGISNMWVLLLLAMIRAPSQLSKSATHAVRRRIVGERSPEKTHA